MTFRKQKGHKATLEVDHDDDSTFTSIPAVFNMGPPGQKRGKIDNTTLDDDVVQYDDDGAIEVSEMTFEIPDDPDHAMTAILENLLDQGSDAKVKWRYTLNFKPTPKTREFTGWVMEFTGGKIESKATSKVTVTIVPTSRIVTI